MEFDILKRYTKEQRINRILEIKKEEKERELNLDGSVNQMKSKTKTPDEMTLIQIERINKQLEEKEYLKKKVASRHGTGCENHTENKVVINQNTFFLKDQTSPLNNNWDEIYRER